MIQVAIMLVIGSVAGAASFTHVHDVAAAHGQPGRRAWADAVVLEPMSVASGLELRRRKCLHAPLTFPACDTADTAPVVAIEDVALLPPSRPPGDSSPGRRAERVSRHAPATALRARPAYDAQVGVRRWG
jgi:hypothetical protein